MLDYDRKDFRPQEPRSRDRADGETIGHQIGKLPGHGAVKE
jgi:hypothetical protein